MQKPKIAVVTLGHYIYFAQFEHLKEELMAKTDDFIRMIKKEDCEIYDAGYVDCVEDAFRATREMKREDADLLFVLLSTYVPSAVCAPFARYLDIPYERWIEEIEKAVKPKFIDINKKAFLEGYEAQK